MRRTYCGGSSRPPAGCALQTLMAGGSQTVCVSATMSHCQLFNGFLVFPDCRPRFDWQNERGANLMELDSWLLLLLHSGRRVLNISTGR